MADAGEADNTGSGPVFVIDDDDAVRALICDTLDASGFQVRGFSAAAEVMATPDLAGAACVISDIRMPEINGIELQRWLAQHFPLLRVILVTGYAEVAMAVQAMKDGAFDFIEKPFSPAALVGRVRAAIAAGDGEAAARALVERVRRLSAREADVLRELAEGKSYKEIARDLGISARTVEHHRENIAEKLEAGSLAAMVRAYTHWLHLG
jgi:two-component system response regulator FixJ